ncbi:MAG: glycosyltransferase family 4 protein [Christensenellaceae bacterium]|jgi:glycosyltransferase involved in cell wall biosynthesis
MNIGIDVQPLVSYSKYRGIGMYTLGLLEEMFRQDTENQYFLFNMYTRDGVSIELTHGKNVHYNYFHMGRNTCLIEYVRLNEKNTKNRHEDMIGALYRRFIKENKIDTFLLTTTLDTWCMYKKEWFRDTNLAMIVYDIIPILFAKEYQKDISGVAYCENAVDLWKHADKLLAISGSVKSDLTEYIGIDESKIDVIYSGVDTRHAQAEFTKEEQRKLYNRIGINKKFLIFPSAGDFRKNTNATIEAFGLLPDHIKNRYQLVVTGYLMPYEQEVTTEKINAAGLHGKVILTGYLEHEELSILYRTAELLVFPSLYEGFGLPVVEAYTCGLNVLTSNCSSLVEVAEDAAVLVDPHSVESIAKGMEEALTKTDFSVFKDTIEKRIEQFTWPKTAARTLDALLKLPAKAAPEKPKQKQKLAFFAPYNTENEDLKQSYLSIYNTLCKEYGDVAFFVEAQYADAAPAGVKAHDAALYPAYKSQYPERLYYVADRKENLYMLSILKEHAGTVVLYDDNLQQSVYTYFVEEKKDWDSYQAILAQEIGNAEEIVDAMKGDPAAAQKVRAELPINRIVADNAKKLIVNDRIIKAKFLEQNIGRLIYTVLLNKPHMTDKSPLRKKYGIADERFVLAVADASVSLAEDLRVVFDVVSKLKNKDVLMDVYLRAGGQEYKAGIMQMAEEYGLAENICFAGEKQQEWREYLQLSDVAVKLAHEQAGQSKDAFYFIMRNARILIMLEGSVKGLFPEDSLIFLDYADQTYHLEETLRRLVTDKRYKEQRETALSRCFDANMEAHIAGVLMEDEKAAITEKLLRSIYRTLQRNQYATDTEYRMIADTVAYILNGNETAPVVSENTAHSSNGLDVKQIMQEIYTENA